MGGVSLIRTDPDAVTAPPGSAIAPYRAVTADQPGLDPVAIPATNGLADSFTAERCGWSLVWLAVLVGGLSLWGSWSGWPPGGVVAPLLVLVGIGGLAGTWRVRTPRTSAFQLSGLISVIAGVLAQQGAAIHARQYYTTDSAAFNQEAARLLTHGINPYASSLASASRLLQTPSAYWTYTVDGGHVTHVSYPAGSFLLEVPLLALGAHHLVVDWLDLIAWVVTGVLLFVLVPVALRWFSVLLLAVSVFAGMFAAGGTDAVFLPFLVLAVWRWDRFGTGTSAGLARWVGPVALGLACSMKQTPWFCVPFVLIGLVLEARAAGRRPVLVAATYLSVVSGVFVAVNLPFIIWGPRAWLSGTLLPFTQPLVADGQGLVTLALHGVARGVALPWLTAAGMLVLASLLAAMVVWYPQMKRLWMLLVPLTFFVAARSLSSYLVDLLPAAMVAAVTVGSVSGSDRAGVPGRWRRRMRMSAMAVPVAAAVAALVVVVLAFVAVPLDLVVRSVATSRATTVIDAVTLTVTNTTDQSVTPHFMVTTTTSGHPNGFWHPLHRTRLVLAPRASATVTIVPDAPTSAPTYGAHWLVQAYTSTPEALSTTGLLSWTPARGPINTR